MSAKEYPRDHYVEAVIDYFFPDGLGNEVQDAITSGRARRLRCRKAPTRDTGETSRSRPSTE